MVIRISKGFKGKSWADFFKRAKRNDVPNDFMADRDQGAVRQPPFVDWNETENEEGQQTPDVPKD